MKSLSLKAQRQMLAAAGYGSAAAVRGASKEDIATMIASLDGIHAKYSAPKHHACYCGFAGVQVCDFCSGLRSDCGDITCASCTAAIKPFECPMCETPLPSTCAAAVSCPSCGRLVGQMIGQNPFSMFP